MTMAAAILRDEPNMCVDKTVPIEIRSSNAGLNLPQPTWRCNTGLSDITLYYGPEYHPAGKPQRRAVGAFSEGAAEEAGSDNSATLGFFVRRTLVGLAPMSYAASAKTSYSS